MAGVRLYVHLFPSDEDRLVNHDDVWIIITNL